VYRTCTITRSKELLKKARMSGEWVVIGCQGGVGAEACQEMKPNKKSEVTKMERDLDSGVPAHDDQGNYSRPK